MSSWAKKLDKKLSGLTDSSSRESIQPLAKWLGFNRKHGPVFAKAFADAIDNTNVSSRQWLLLQILHEALILDNEIPDKWDRLSDLRKCLGEQTILAVVGKLGRDAAMRKKIEALVKQWDELNVFGGPTLVAQIRRLLSSSAQEVKIETTAPVKTSAETEKTNSPPEPAQEGTKNEEKKTEEKKSEEHESKEQKIEELKDDETRSEEKDERKKVEEKNSAQKEEKMIGDVKPVKKEESKPVQVSNESSKDQSAGHKHKNVQQTLKANDTNYDFESKGIPYGKVDARDFLDPCKEITALQISRDLSNDAAVQLSSLLSSIPEDVKAMCEEADKHVKSTGEAFELPEEKARSFAIRTSEELLDKNLDEALDGINIFLTNIHKQRQARKMLINLLIRSRCKFGASETAESFYNIDETIDQLQKKKQTLKDAMDLEFIDFEEQPTNEASVKDDKLEPLSWYDRTKPEAKRARIE